MLKESLSALHESWPLISKYLYATDYITYLLWLHLGILRSILAIHLVWHMLQGVFGRVEVQFVGIFFLLGIISYPFQIWFELRKQQILRKISEE
jgi:hypothetical protein